MEKTSCTIITYGWTNKKKGDNTELLGEQFEGAIFLKHIDIDAFITCRRTDNLLKMMDDCWRGWWRECCPNWDGQCSKLKEAGEILVAKRKKLYWTLWEANCIALMLENIDKKNLVHQEKITKGRRLPTYLYLSISLVSLLHYFTKRKRFVESEVNLLCHLLTLGCLGVLNPK